MKIQRFLVGLACVVGAAAAGRGVRAQSVQVSATSSRVTTQSSTQSFVVNGGSISSTTYRANCYNGSPYNGSPYNGSPYNSAPVYVYPNGYGCGGGYNNGTVVIIGNGTTVINNPQPYGYSYPYGYGCGVPVVVGSQYNYGINGFSVDFGRGGISFNANIQNFPAYSTFTPGSLPASSYAYNPSIPANWNNAPNYDYGNYGRVTTYGAVNAQRNNTDLNTANRNATTTTAANANAAQTTTQTNLGASDGVVEAKAQENTTWGNAAGWSLNDTRTAIPSWPSTENSAR